MNLALSLLFILSFPCVFGFAIAYFIALFKYKKILVIEVPNLWNAERSKTHLVQTWAPLAYNIFRTSKNGSFEGHQSSVDLKNAYNRVKILLRITTCFLFMLIITGILLDAMS